MSNEVNYQNVANKLAGQLATAQLNLAAVSDLAEQYAQKNAQLEQENAELKSRLPDGSAETND